MGGLTGIWGGQPPGHCHTKTQVSCTETPPVFTAALQRLQLGDRKSLSPHSWVSCPPSLSLPSAPPLPPHPGWCGWGPVPIEAPRRGSLWVPRSCCSVVYPLGCSKGCPSQWSLGCPPGCPPGCPMGYFCPQRRPFAPKRVWMALATAAPPCPSLAPSSCQTTRAGGTPSPRILQPGVRPGSGAGSRWAILAGCLALPPGPGVLNKPFPSVN